jgi:hypothetical protein
MSTDRPCACGATQKLQTTLSIGDPKAGNEDTWAAYRCPDCRDGVVVRTGIVTGK